MILNRVSTQSAADDDQESPAVQQMAFDLYQRLSARFARNSRARGLSTLAWGREYLAPHFTHPASRMHLWLAKQLDACRFQRGCKISLIGPRGAAKSTIGSLAYPLRAALEGRERYIWLVSDTNSQAATHLENIKAELDGNPLLASDYSHAVGHGDHWRADSIQLANGVVIEAFGTGQRIRGRKRRESRPTLIICDDLQNDSHIISASQRDKSRDWFYGALLKAGTKDTNVVSLATALHRDALAMALDHAPGWNSAKFSAILEWPENMTLWSEWEKIYCNVEAPYAKQHAWNYFLKNRRKMTAGAVLLWPEHEDLYALMKMRVEEGRTAFEREKQNSPIDPDRCEWPEEYFGEHIWFDEWPKNVRLKTIALDPSKGADSRHGDYSALVVLGVDHAGTLYVEADLARRPTPRMVADTVTLCARHVPDALGVEANQFQELLAGEINDEFRRQGVHRLPVSLIRNDVNKHVRIRRLGPYLSLHKIRFRAGHPSTTLLVEQLRDFPLASHDDGPDALEMALRLAEQAYRGANSDGLGYRLPVSD